MGRYLLLLLVIAAMILSGCGLAGNGVQSGSQEGMRLPDAEFTRLDGSTLKLSELRGKPAVINFWATWCGPCLEEMPLLQAVYASSQGQHFELLAVTEEGQAEVHAFLTANALQLPVALDPNGQANQDYHIQGIPTTFFLDSTGVVVVRHIGTLTPESLQLFLWQITGEPSGPTSTTDRPIPTRPPQIPAPPPTPHNDIVRQRWPDHA
jgi:thiol-disulfide isomerase/thioredoxin